MDEEGKEAPSLNLENLKALSVLGRGGKGVVFLVQNQNSKENLAFKAISKAFVERKKKNHEDRDGYRRIWFERDVLKLFRHPLLPKLRGLVVADKIVGYAIDYCPGRDLNSLRKSQTEKMFCDDIIRFYAAELVLALEYLHGLGIVYRDLKPENIMIQENGHLMLVDFDLSTKLSEKCPKFIPSMTRSETLTVVKKKRFPLFYPCSNSVISPEDEVPSAGKSVVSLQTDAVSGGKSHSFVGTEEYVAPEIILSNGHDFAVDWWGLGIVLYEMLYGRTPFRGTSRKDTFYSILTKTPELIGDQTALRNLIGKLLEKEPNKRISVEEIKGHDFFQEVDWCSVLQIARPPFIPVPHGEEDTEGIKGIDMELFVEGIFNIDDVENNKYSRNYNSNSQNKGTWNNFTNPSRTEEFLFF